MSRSKQPCFQTDLDEYEPILDLKPMRPKHNDYGYCFLYTTSLDIPIIIKALKQYYKNLHKTKARYRGKEIKDERLAELTMLHQSDDPGYQDNSYYKFRSRFWDARYRFQRYYYDYLGTGKIVLKKKQRKDDSESESDSDSD